MKIAPGLLFLPFLSITLWSCNQPNGKPINPYANGAQHPWRQAQDNAPALKSGFLSDQQWVSASGGWGPIAKDASNGEQYEETTSTSSPISIGGKQYAKGLGTHANSSIIYNLAAANSCKTFKAVVGLDDEIRTQSQDGSVIFQVWMDAKQVWNSGRLTLIGNPASEAVNLPVTGTKTLELRVTDAEDGLGYDHADWADAQIECGIAATPASSTKIQFEDFKQGGEGVGYHDNDAVNQGGLYRTSEGVDIDKRGDADGYEIGWAGSGEWIKYDLNAAAGSYDLNIRYGTWKAGEKLEIFVDDTKVLTAEFPNISSLDAHQVLKAGTVNLTAGAHVVKAAYVGGNPGINLDWMEFAPMGETPPPPPSPSPAPTPPPSPSPTPPPPAPSSRQLYVSPSGDDSNPGTLGQPFRTIQKGVDSATPGTDVMLRGGTYAERVNIRNSGSAGGGYVTLRSYPGERGVIDGQSVSLPKFEALVTINEQQYVRVADITITNAVGPGPFAVAIGGASHHIELRDSTVSSIKTTDQWARGITVGNTRADASMHDILIANNDVSDMPKSLGEMIALSGNIENSQVIGNRLSKMDIAIGIDLLGNYDGIDDPNVGFARNILVADNTLRDGNHLSICLYVDGGSRVTFERNQVFNCGTSIQVTSEIAGLNSSDNIVRDNLVVGCIDTCLAIGGWISSYGEAINTLVTNNTIYNADNGNAVQMNRSRDTRLINNVIVNQNGASLNNTNGASGLTLNNNLWYGAGGWNWNGAYANSFGAYQAASGQDSNSLFADPLFVNLGGTDLRLQAGSPAINRGDASVISSGERDLDGKPRQVGGVDIGAYER
jgi:NPCBM/NEW2 domain/DUF5010 C-terminal domain/Right handed beta helix region